MLADDFHRAKIINDSFSTEISRDGSLVLVRGEEVVNVWTPHDPPEYRLALQSPYYLPPDHRPLTAGLARLSQDGKHLTLVSPTSTNWRVDMRDARDGHLTRDVKWDFSQGEPFLLTDRLAIGVTKNNYEKTRPMQVWNLLSMTPTKRLAEDAPGPINDSQVSASGVVALRFYSDKMGGRLVRLHDGETLANIREGWSALSFSPESATLAHGIGDGHIFWRSLKTGQRIGSFVSGPVRPLYDLLFVDEVGLITNEGSTVRLWELDLPQLERGETPRVSHEMVATNDRILKTALSPDKKWLATGHAGGEVILWSAKTWTPVAELAGHQDMIRSLQFSADSSTILSADLSGDLRHWSIDRHWRPVICEQWRTELQRLTISREVVGEKTLIRIEGKPTL